MMGVGGNMSTNTKPRHLAVLVKALQDGDTITDQELVVLRKHYAEVIKAVVGNHDYKIVLSDASIRLNMVENYLSARKSM
jgi:predicted phosphodiesterase